MFLSKGSWSSYGLSGHLSYWCPSISILGFFGYPRVIDEDCLVTSMVSLFGVQESKIQFVLSQLYPKTISLLNILSSFYAAVKDSTLIEPPNAVSA